MNDRDNPGSSDDISRAQELASRYRCEFVDLQNFKPQSDVVRPVPLSFNAVGTVRFLGQFTLDGVDIRGPVPRATASNYLGEMLSDL